MAPNHKSFTNAVEEQNDIILGLLVVFIAIVIVIVFYLVMRLKGEAPTLSNYAKMSESEYREGSIVSQRSCSTFSRNTYNTEPKPAPSIYSETSSVARSTSWETVTESDTRRLERSMQLAANMIEAMHLPVDCRDRDFSRDTALREMLWQNSEHRTYYLELFDLIAYDPDIYLKLEEEAFLLDNPEPVLLVADTLRRFTMTSRDAKIIISDLKLRLEAGLDLNAMEEETKSLRDEVER